MGGLDILLKALGLLGPEIMDQLKKIPGKLPTGSQPAGNTSAPGQPGPLADPNKSPLQNNQTPPSTGEYRNQRPWGMQQTGMQPGRSQFMDLLDRRMRTNDRQRAAEYPVRQQIDPYADQLSHHHNGRMPGPVPVIPEFMGPRPEYPQPFQISPPRTDA